MQYQDADNWALDLTYLAAKLASNLFLVMKDIVCKCWRANICKIAHCKSERHRCFAHCTSTDLALKFCTGYNSERVNWFLTRVLTRHSRFVCETLPIYVGGTALLVIRMQTGAGGGDGTPDKIQSVLLFLKTSNPFQVSKFLIYARSPAPLSCTGWVDPAGCGPD